MKLTPEQERKINAACRNFQKKMQKLVDRPNSGVNGVSMTVDGKTVKIAGPKKENT